MTLKTGVEGEWGIVLDKMRCRLCNILTSLGRVLVPDFDSDETISQVALHAGMMLICRPFRGRYLTGVVVRQLWRVFPTENYMAMQGTLSHLSKRVCLAFRSVSRPGPYDDGQNHMASRTMIIFCLCVCVWTHTNLAFGGKRVFSRFFQCLQVHLQQTKETFQQALVPGSDCRQV